VGPVPTEDCSSCLVAFDNTSVAGRSLLVHRRTGNDRDTGHAEEFRVVHYLLVADRKHLTGWRSAVSFHVRRHCHRRGHQVVGRELGNSPPEGPPSWFDDGQGIKDNLFLRMGSPSDYSNQHKKNALIFEN